MEVGDQGADIARAVLLAALPAALPHIINVPDQPPCHPVTWHLQNKLYARSAHGHSLWSAPPESGWPVKVAGVVHRVDLACGTSN